jgi:tetratricopeptide (TPR) repeat protein
MIILDLLASNNWERPIYWAITVGRNKYMNLQDYFQVEGFAYRLVPIKGQSQPDRLIFGNVATDLMYDNLMNKFAWGGMNDPKVYIDENNMRMMTNVRNSFNRLAGALIDEGKKDSAIAVIDRCFELVPSNLVEPEYFSMELANNYFRAGATEKGLEVLNQAFEIFENDLGYFFSLDRKFVKTQGINEEIQRSIFYLQIMERTARNNGQTEFAQKVGEAMQGYFAKFTAI